MPHAVQRVGAYPGPFAQIRQRAHDLLGSHFPVQRREAVLHECVQQLKTGTKAVNGDDTPTETETETETETTAYHERQRSNLGVGTRQPFLKCFDDIFGTDTRKRCSETRSQGTNRRQREQQKKHTKTHNKHTTNTRSRRRTPHLSNTTLNFAERRRKCIERTTNTHKKRENRRKLTLGIRRSSLRHRWTCLEPNLHLTAPPTSRPSRNHLWKP